MHLVTNIHEKAGKMLEGKLKLGYAVRSPGGTIIITYNLAFDRETSRFPREKVLRATILKCFHVLFEASLGIKHQRFKIKINV